MISGRRGVTPSTSKSRKGGKGSLLKTFLTCVGFAGVILVLLNAGPNNNNTTEPALLLSQQHQQGNPKSMDQMNNNNNNNNNAAGQTSDMEKAWMKEKAEKIKQAAAELAAQKEQLARERLQFEQQKQGEQKNNVQPVQKQEPPKDIPAKQQMNTIKQNIPKRNQQNNNNNNNNNKKPQKSVVCGGHKAASCELCPQGNGAAWCNGDCTWCGDTKTCLPRDAFCPTCTTLAMHDPIQCAALPATDQCRWCPIATQCMHVDSICPTERVWAAPEDEPWFTPPDPISKYDRTLSIVLPCGSENDFFERTIRSIHAATPPEILKDIIVIDDNSVPPLEPMFSLDQDEYKVSFIRSNVSLGLIDAKHQGALAATGDIIVFFDCHVKPALGYWEPFVREIAENPQRVVVPSITHLDVDFWTESNRPKDNLGGNSKCYTTLDSDFKWVANDKPWVPTMSGGLLAIDRNWFFEIGGHDQNMKGWGGENIDLSFRIWRCGGEIIAATQSYVAHMWRNAKPATKAKYRLPPNAVFFNRARAMKAHAPEMFGNKTLTYPAFAQWRETGGSDLNVSSILDPMKKLQCKDFNWYLDFFSYIYRDAGIIPKEVFQLSPDDGVTCLMLRNRTSWAPNRTPQDELVLGKCTTISGLEATSGTQYWHLANIKKPEKKCCSGLQAWNTNQCIVGDLRTFSCASMIGGQKAVLRGDGSLKLGPQCLNVNPLSLAKCNNDGQTQKWKKLRPFQPPEFIAMSKELQAKW